MSTKQTRRSISVRGATYDALRSFCDQNGRSMSEIVEEQIAQVLRATPAATEKPAPTRTVKAPARPRPVANKVVRAREAAPVEEARPARAAAVGRPAPTPARAVVPERPRAPKGDYRSIQF